ncbi:MAG TPA: hypothetical protein VNM34_15105 [Verrucomicrobiae bacterium]|nr:hypothetical protein [Verrucomicrobiae bacterium]
MQIIASQVLANGLRTEFADTYLAINNRQADGRLAQVMDLGIGATNRQHEFAYFEAAPHMTYWRRGDPIPSDAMRSVQWAVPVYTWGRRIPWHKEDRKDDQTGSLFDMARMAGNSAALLPIRFFFDVITNATNTLPAVPLAPDGASIFATTAGGLNRFGVSSGNLLSGSGVATVSAILTDYYRAIAQWKLFQDGKGQPLLSDEIIDMGATIIHGAANTQVFEQAFLQKRQGTLGSASGTPSNIVQDASRNVELWSTARITDNDWFLFLKNPPKKAAFLLDRQGVEEFSSLEGDNNGDRTRDTGEEYVQWERRAGAGVALPYAAIKIDN